ncbi:MAG: hypothetical protein DMG14_20495 [Acidobacteria bacterium]|nr:MAG: hypothetical protein DMG14_20495 [Acidobacteriota bacterium]
MLVSFVVQSALLLGLLIVCCFAPGFFFVRRLRLSPIEKLCASIGLSLILLYLDTWIVYLAAAGSSGTRMPRAPFALSSAACVVLGVLAWKDLFRFVRLFRVKRALLGYGFLLLWTLVILAMIRVYSGGPWSGDWQEHFQRTLFFLQRLPATTMFAGVYQLPARPPLMNVLAAYFLAQTQDRFELFQILFTFLNLLIFLPCCLLLPALGGVRRPRILPLVLLFALNPVVMQNATYSWTRGLTAFFVVLGIAFYLRAWRKNDGLRMVAAFVSLAAGILVHYSAGPYVLFLTFHYLLWVFWRRPHKWKELAAIGTTSTVLLATWFAWAVVVYGEAALLSNTTITSTQRYQGSNIAKVAANLFDSIVPVLVRDRSLMNTFEQPNSIGRVRDVAFVSYQMNLVFAMGIIGGPVVLWLLFRRVRRRSPRHRLERLFWLALVLFSTVIGVAVVGERDPLGVAHGTLLPLEVTGLTLLATVIYRRRRLTNLILAGCVVDFSLGVFLHAHVQNLENAAGKTYFSQLEYSNGIIQHAKPGPYSLSEVAWTNWFAKHQRALCDEWLIDLPERHKSDAGFQIVWPAAQAEIVRLKNQDELEWGGWYSRHGGVISHFGDHITGTIGESVPATILLALATGLVVTFIRQTGTVRPLRLAKAAQSAQVRRKRGKAMSR